MPFSQTSRVATPDEAVLRFVEGELKNRGRLDGLATMAFLHRLQQRGVSPSQRAGVRLALAMYGERVDPSARALLREAL